MDAIMAIAAKHKLWVIEDCAQAHLAKIQGPHGRHVRNRRVVLAFIPARISGAMGDAGAVITNDAALAERMAMFARHGGLTKGDHQIEGINSRLDGLQAAVLSVKLPHLPAWTARRQEIAAEYAKLLAGIDGLGLPVVAAGRYARLSPVRRAPRAARCARAHIWPRSVIQTVINYPVALPFLPAYTRFGHRPEDFPNAFRNQSRVLSLPIFPEMTAQQMAIVVGAIRSFPGA